MATKTTMTITHGSESVQTVKDLILAPSTKPRAEAVQLSTFFDAASLGNRACFVELQVSSGTEVKASGTLTLGTTVATNTAVVSGTTFTCVDDRETTDITYAADSGGSKNSTYYLFQNQPGTKKYYVWFDINSAGVDPAPTGRIGIKVKGATGATAATLATATVTATAGAAYATTTFGADSSGSLNSTFFKFSSSDNAYKYYIWFNINSAGVDPGTGATAGSELYGYEGIEVAGATDASAATLATAAVTACVGLLGMTVVTGGSGVLYLSNFRQSEAAVLSDGITAPTRFTMVQALDGVTITAGASGHVIVRNIVSGTATATADGAATSTGFTFTHSITGSAPSAVQFQVGASDTLTAVNLAAAINANTAMSHLVTATSAAAIVTVSSYYPGPVGNYITLAVTGGITRSAATLASGAVASSYSTLNTYNLGVTG